jgi:[histone H3]-lysine4 N-trimethyltransferase ASH1L
MKNSRKIQKHRPELAQFQTLKNSIECDPKVQFLYISSHLKKSSLTPKFKIEETTQNEPETKKTDEKNNEVELEIKPETEIVLQPLSEQSQLLWQICERLESLHKNDFKDISIPPTPSSDHHEITNHDRISVPISFDEIKTNVKLGQYDLNPHLFHYVMKILLDNVVKFWGVNCDRFTTMLKIRDTYKEIRTEMIEDIKRVWSDELLVNAMMDKVIKKPAKNRKKIVERQHDEDIVNCHCGRYLEEGVMIQCQKCLTWQHVDCVGADVKDENYICGKCDGKEVEMEIIKKDEKTADDHQCYLTLMRGDLQV